MPPFTLKKPEPPTIEPELDAPYKAWKTTTGMDETATILKHLEPTIDQGIRLFTGQSVASPNLRSRARQTALQALRTYDPARGKLRTHITNAMQGMRRINRKEQTPIAIPDRIFLDRARIAHHQADLEYQLGREPSDSELADRSGISMGRITKVRAMTRPSIPTSRFENIEGEENTGFMPAVVSKPTHDLLHAAIYDELDGVGKKIMEWTLGYNGHPVLQNAMIAKKLGISPSAITQRKERIQNRMDELSRMGGF